MKTRAPVAGELITKRKLTICQHTTPCSDCPWRRNALPGWLGGFDVDYWLQAAHGDGQIMCHTTNHQCAGAAIYRANVVKTPRSEFALRLPPDRDKVFARPDEFREHHED